MEIQNNQEDFEERAEERVEAPTNNQNLFEIDMKDICDMSSLDY